MLVYLVLWTPSLQTTITSQLDHSSILSSLTALSLAFPMYLSCCIHSVIFWKWKIHVLTPLKTYLELPWPSEKWNPGCLPCVPQPFKIRPIHTTSALQSSPPMMPLLWLRLHPGSHSPITLWHETCRPSFISSQSHDLFSHLVFTYSHPSARNIFTSFLCISLPTLI